MRLQYILRFALLCCLAGCGGSATNNTSIPDTAQDRGPDPFVFSTASKAAYAQVDRMGQPVVATVLLHTPQKDSFNQAEPANDGDYAGFMTDRLEELHRALDQQLIDSGLTPCVLDVCLRQVLSKIVPDTLQLDLTQPDGFPNGRRFKDITVDRILSMALTDTTTPGMCNGEACNVHSVEKIPLDPIANEVPLLTAFPYLAPPHP